MKKGKSVMMITIGIIFMVLTAIIFVQIKTINQTDILALENMRESELREEIANAKKKYEDTLIKIQETNDIIAEYQAIIETGRQATELLAQELKQSKDLLGKNDVTGERNNCNFRRWKK